MSAATALDSACATASVNDGLLAPNLVNHDKLRRACKHIVGIVALVATTQAHCSDPKFTFLSTSFQSYASAINNNGVASGWVSDGDFFARQASIFFAGSTVKLGWNGPANMISDSGTAVGSAIQPMNGTRHAMLWNGYTAIDIGNFRNSSSYAVGINNSGTAVGFIRRSDDQTKALAWSGSSFTALESLGGELGDFLGADYTVASAINDDGVIVGTSNDIAGNNKAVRWNGGHIEDLGALSGFTSSYALDINAKNQVVGYSEKIFFPPDGLYVQTYRATIWSDGQIFELQSLADGYNSLAEDINIHGQIVGSAVIDSSGRGHATLWQGGTVIDLNTIIDPASLDEGWYLGSATGINDLGWIVGVAYNDVGDRSRAFMLQISPVPDVSSFALFLLGLPLVGAVSRRRTSV